MTLENALARLCIQTQSSVHPVLTEQELTDLLAMHALADVTGTAPNAAGWEGTWDVREATRQGWLLKAGKVAGDPSYSQDGARYELSDVYRHCVEMAAKYQGFGSVSLRGAL